MKLMALLDQNNKIVNTSVANDDWQGENWIEYTLDNPAYIGGDYVENYFYAPQPYPSWSRNKGIWDSPTPMPQDGKFYNWNETTQEWQLFL